jgi:hypothetical protein
MKYPKLRAEWIPVENPDGKGITHQNFKAYINGELFFEEDYDPDQNSAEFVIRLPSYDPPIPPWNSTGKLNRESLTVTTTMQAISETFSSDVIESEPLHLSDIDIGNPSNLEVFVMPFPENYEEVDWLALQHPVPSSGVI